MKKYIIKQEDNADCGACALLSIIKYYKGYIPLEVIKIDTLTSSEGTNFYNLKMASIKYGFTATGFKTTNLKNIRLPCIAQIKINNFCHFITIYEINENITYIDPASGIHKVPLNEFNQMFTGYILELIPAGKIIKYEKNQIFQKILIDIYKRHLKKIIMIFFIMLTVVALSLITGFNPLLLKNTKLIPLIIIISLIKISLTYVKNNLISHLNKEVNISLLENYLERIFNLPLKYLQLKMPGDFLNRIKDLDSVKSLFSKTILDVIIITLLVIFSAILLFIIEFRLTILLFFISLVYIIVLYILNKTIYNKIIFSIESDNNLIDKIVEYLNKVLTIKTNRSLFFKNNISFLIKDSNIKKLDLEKKTNKFEFISSLFEEIVMVLILIYFYNYSIKVEFILLYLMIFNYYFDGIKYYINLLPMIMYFKDIFHRIKSIYDIEIEIPKKKLDKNIYLNNISYTYNNIDYVLENITLKIPIGNKVLIKGTNGSGKSTLLDIIYGNITDYEGLATYNNKISYIHQDAEIFQGSIIDNITLGKKYDAKKILLISKVLLLDKLINSKLNGVNFTITNLSNLSGGEKQKIILARALYNDFNILLLDESLNEIAKDERKLILKNLFKHYKLKTIIYISHHKDNLNYDQIIDLTARKEKYVNG
ncbi:MAG: cysteine peptidase family C39 domain-containing protein [Bacilli bacterium]|nr:cysteine peptidase family C39 domain-containing protein [Bacilli bacterium]